MPRLRDTTPLDTMRFQRQLEDLLSTPPGRVRSMELRHEPGRTTFDLIVTMSDTYYGGGPMPGSNYTFELTVPAAERYFGGAALAELAGSPGSRPVIYRGERWEVGSAPGLQWEYEATPPADPPRGAIDLAPEILDALPDEALALIRQLRLQLRTARRMEEDLTARLANSESRGNRAVAELATSRAEVAQLLAQSARRGEEATLLRREATALAELKHAALIWRDHGTGAEAQLDAFKNFCAVLDSLPAAQETPSPDFVLAG